MWGAVTATFAVGWNLVRDLKDSGKLRVDAMVGKMLGDTSKRWYLTITVTNVGRRPILLQGLFIFKRQRWLDDFWTYRVAKYRVRKPYALLPLKQGPKMLTEGEFHTELLEDFSFVDGELAGIGAIDSGGREWLLKGKRLRFLVDRANEARETPEAETSS